MGRLLVLDRSIPFVDAVFSTTAGARYIAVDLLIDAERRHGVRVIRDDECGSLADTWAPRPTAPGTVGEFLALIRTARETVPTRYRTNAEFAFLDETSMILGGTDFANDHWIVTPGGVVSSWTQRAWGAQLGRWTARTQMSPSAGWRRLDATDLTYYLNAHVEDYERWVLAVREVIRLKCERQLDTPLAD
jgi:hypothetical protein